MISTGILIDEGNREYIVEFEVLWGMRGGRVLELLDFSLRILMPWLGKA
jgi:hypothetical protein